MFSIDSLIDRTAYNKFKTVRSFGYRILCYLIEKNEEIWKLLKYNTPDALSKPNLTIKEKRDLIFTGNGDSEDFRIFRSPFLDDAITSQEAQLRIYNSVLSPGNRSVGTVDICIECLCHNKIINLDNYESRIEVMIQQVLECLNGADIAGVGVLAFDKDMSEYDICRMNIYNNRNFFGATIWMSVKVGDIDDEV